MAQPKDDTGDLNCETDPIGSLKRMFIDMTVGPRLRAGQDPAQRAVFLKPHGVAHGRLTVRPELDTLLQHGLFVAGREYPAWVRISSDTIPSLPDKQTTIGFAIKLFNVEGAKLFGSPDERTHDLILQNHDVFFVDNAAQMCAFTQAGIAGDYDTYIKAHPQTGAILDEMKKDVPSVLGATYWSVLPYGFGQDRVVKYKLEPVGFRADGASSEANDPNYLAVDLRHRLQTQEARFRFLVQFQTDPITMPVDRAMVRWSETSSPPVEVATLVLSKQDVETRGQAAYGENLSFNPWRALADHEPKGDIAAVRRVVYEAGATVRRDVNGVPDGEPEHPRPTGEFPMAKDRTIVSARIHPAIGVARVGNAKAAFFIGPEVISPPAESAGFYRDEQGALKRQAARFRIFGYNSAGEAVSELTADNAEVTWAVQLANLKASWFQFQIALDIPEAADALVSARRNANVNGADRAALEIRPSQKSISGRSLKGAGYAFDDGAYKNTPVYLGELQTDEAGRLLVLGGRGVASSPSGTQITDFANNDDWYDDISDGPVTATVRIAGREVAVDPAWVVVAPPNYAPQLKAVRTMYDLLTEVFIDAGQLTAPNPISFQNDIYPIFHRLQQLQWVNQGFAKAFGAGGWLDLSSPTVLAKLTSTKDGPDAEYRRQIANAFREYDKDSWSPVPLPWVYGDGMDIPAVHTPRQHTQLAKQQIRCLQLWAAGNFKSDLSAEKPAATLADVPLVDQPAMLDRAALEFCLADAFHPGCEITWPIRHASMFMAPFRLRHRPTDQLDPTLGPTLSPRAALAFEGVLYGQRAGWISRWMAVPWHADTASCRSGYEPEYDPYLPTFWPARVPNQVLAPADYAVVMESNDPAKRRDAFAHRTDWDANGLGGDGYLAQVRRMPERFGEMGVVEVRDGRKDDPDIPPTVMVADRPLQAPVVAKEALAGVVVVQPKPAEGGNWLGRFGRYPRGLTNQR